MGIRNMTPSPFQQVERQLGVRPASLQMQRPGVAPPKTAPTIGKPAPPPVYRPQAVPRVLQTKTSAPPQNANQSRCAPPTRRAPHNQTAPQAVLPKIAGGQYQNKGQSPRPPAAPPVFRPQPTAKCLQPKTATEQRPTPRSPGLQKPAAPAVCIPRSKPGVLQQKIDSGGPRGPSAQTIRRPQVVPRASHMPATAPALQPKGVGPQQLNAGQVRRLPAAAPAHRPGQQQVVQRSPGDLTPELLVNIFSRLPHRDVKNASLVNKNWNLAANATPLEGTETKLSHLNHAMRGHELIGYHGTASVNGSSFYQGLTPPQPSGGVSEQLGPGFYLFPVGQYDISGKYGKRDLPKAVRSWSVGIGRSVFRVFARGLALASIYNRETQGGTKNPTSSEEPYLRPPFAAVIDYLSGYYQEPELKLNPHFYENDLNSREANVQIAPPSNPEGSLGREFLDAIMARLRR